MMTVSVNCFSMSMVSFNLDCLVDNELVDAIQR